MYIYIHVKIEQLDQQVIVDCWSSYVIFTYHHEGHQLPGTRGLLAAGYSAAVRDAADPGDQWGLGRFTQTSVIIKCISKIYNII